LTTSGKAERQDIPESEPRRGGLAGETAWLDGEIVHLDDAGFPDLRATRRDMRGRAERWLIFYVFDLPWLNGEWRPNQRRFWLRPDVTAEIRSLPRRPGRLLRHATAVRRV
jgi:ATP-dependent DNA ligase